MTDKEDERITRARAYYLAQAKMQQAIPSVKECFEGDPLPEKVEGVKYNCLPLKHTDGFAIWPTEHEFRTRNFGLRTQLQAEGAQPCFAEAYATCKTTEEQLSLALAEIGFLNGVICTHEHINRSLLDRQTSLIMSYRSLSRAHLRLVSSFWERLKFLFAGF